VDRITHAVAAGWSQEPFSVILPAAGVFPDSGAPRVICLAAGEGLNALGTLHTAVCRRLEELIFRHEEGVFRAHLTLGRVRHSTPGAGRLIWKVLKGLPLIKLTWRVDRIALYESQLSASGPWYRLLETGFLGPDTRRT